ncbi:MAG: hypothetical protein NVS1B6_18890 [Steroidobacteraceae bacterium]
MSARAPLTWAAPVLAACAAAAPAEDILDIRGPRDISPAWLVPALLAAVLVLAIVGYAAWRWKRRSPPRTPRPWENALQRLDDVRALLDPSNGREFSVALSDIVRQYIEAVFMVAAPHRTTEEFLRDLLESSNASLAAHSDLLTQFLQQCDMAKFAGMPLSRDSMESLRQCARSFVIQTSDRARAEQTREVPQPARAKEAHDSLPST